MKRFVHRPSPAMVVALIALFVALGGSSYAALRIGSAQIKNNSIQSKDIKNRTIRGRDIHRRTIRGSNVGVRSLTGGNIARNKITGSEVLESSLGTVPSANNANHATSADGLTSQRELTYQAAAGTGAADVFDSGKLKLSAACGPGGAVTLTASTRVDHATLQSIGDDTDTNDGDFTTAETPTLSSVNEARMVVYTEPGGQVVVINYAAAEGSVYGTTGCIVKGVAQTL